MIKCLDLSAMIPEVLEWDLTVMIPEALEDLTVMILEALGKETPVKIKEVKEWMTLMHHKCNGDAPWIGTCQWTTTTTRALPKLLGLTIHNNHIIICNRPTLDLQTRQTEMNGINLRGIVPQGCHRFRRNATLIKVLLILRTIHQTCNPFIQIIEALPMRVGVVDMEVVDVVGDTEVEEEDVVEVVLVDSTTIPITTFKVRRVLGMDQI